MTTERQDFKVWICCTRYDLVIIWQELCLHLPEKIPSVFYPSFACSLQQGYLMLAQDQIPFGSRGGWTSPADDLLFSIKLHCYISILQFCQLPTFAANLFEYTSLCLQLLYCKPSNIFYKKQYLSLLVWLHIGQMVWLDLQASLHSLVSCVLNILFQNWPAAATPAWHIQYNDLIIIISLMKAYFYYKRVRLICFTIADRMSLHQKLNASTIGLLQKLSLPCLKTVSCFYKRTLLGLSIEEVQEGVCLAKGRFMGCEGQFEQPVESPKPLRHLPPSITLQ